MNNFYIILVEPAFPGNIGSVARAMKNMGFSNLRLVNPCDFMNEEALKLAVNSVDILENAQVYNNFFDSIADLNITVATSAKKGKYRKPVFEVNDLAPILKNLSIKNKIGIVFGRERIGLTNKEIDKCSLISYINSSDEYNCLNLAQSVLIYCYELAKNFEILGEKIVYETIQTEELDKFFKIFEEILLEIDFLDKNNPDFKMKAIKKIFTRCYLTKNELNLLYGILRQIRNIEHILTKKLLNSN